MSVGFYCTLPYGNAPDLRKKKITEFYKNAYHDDLMSIGQSGIWIRPVPYDEALEILWKDTGIVISAHTNSGGPGYHAMLIRELKGLLRKLKLKESEIEIEDDTGYFHSGDFVALQNEMRKWLIGVSKIVLEKFNENSTFSTFQMGIAVPIDRYPKIDTGIGVFSTLGQYEVARFKKIINDQDDDDALCKDFFLWWNKEQDANYYRNLGLYYMWNEINWLPPVLNEEVEALRSAFEALEKAYTLEPYSFEYPWAPWLRIADLLNDKRAKEALAKRFPGVAAKDEVFGYAQYDIRHELIDAWFITLPGRMHEGYTEKDGWCWWTEDGRSIYASILTAERSEAISERESEAELVKLDQLIEGYSKVSLPKFSGSQALSKRFTVEEDNETFYATCLYAAKANQVLIVSIYNTNESDWDFADHVFATLEK
jgi:hypothetical protein